VRTVGHGGVAIGEAADAARIAVRRGGGTISTLRFDRDRFQATSTMNP